MEYRTFGRIGWRVGEIGYGMWGLADWTGSDQAEIQRALNRAVELGCNFFDSAWVYGLGRSEQILGNLLKQHPGKGLHFTTKIPPKNWKWPSKSHYKIDECFPKNHIIEYTEKSLQNIKVDCLDLQQFHVWEDGWADNDEWKETITKLKQAGKVKHFGISINRWESENVLATLRTGLIDSVQVIYNIFEQAPEDQLFPLCRELKIAVIARVPFDEGVLTGTITKKTKFPKDDWRATYFVPENLNASVEHAEALKSLVLQGMSMPEMALRFILSNPDISVVIPGMRQVRHVETNIATSDAKGLPKELLTKLKSHRWDRNPTEWSQ
jgi:aryl-alcohol dehydrogenase-like predicted oxidoreductase